MTKKPILTAGSLLLVAFGLNAQARSKLMPQGNNHGRFTLLTRAPSGQADKAKAMAALTGSTIVALADGALLLDADSGQLVRLDDKQKPIARLYISRDASQVVSHKGRAYVADRLHDRVVVIDLKDSKLRRVGQFATDAEPFGLAFTPDGSKLLVTTVADQSLSAYTRTGSRLWSIEIGAEPRGVAVAPDGSHALVTSLRTGAVARVDLQTKPKVSYLPLDPTVNSAGAPSMMGGLGFGSQLARPSTGRLRRKHRRQVVRGPARAKVSFARSAFAATFVSSNTAVVPHQMSTPNNSDGRTPERTGSYGGGSAFDPAIVHRIAFVTSQKKTTRIAAARINLHQPRASAYDPKTDTLYVAGYGSDHVMALADASQPTVHLKWQQSVGDLSGACGPTGLAVRTDGQVLVHCSLTRKVARLTDRDSGTAAYVSLSDELTQSRLTLAQQRGRVLFRLGNNTAMSGNGVMACASCHPEGRSDGLSWRIEKKSLQTPFLNGRLMGTHPFKWDGGDKDLQTSLRNTVVRLGGTGLTKNQAKDLGSFLTSLAPPRAPTPKSTTAVAAGKKLFFAEATGCATCHVGKNTTNQKMYDLADDLDKVDTPSLIGLAHSAPYYHDGSAATLRAVLLENGTVHGMGKVSHLSDNQVHNLVAYLKSL